MDRATKQIATALALLDELGFVWDPRDAAWETMFAKLERYKDEHGHFAEHALDDIAAPIGLLIERVRGPSGSG